jgi:hypothetical protein
VAPDRELAVRAVLAWDALAKQSRGRLRPCANDQCHLFLIDRSKAAAPPGQQRIIHGALLSAVLAAHVGGVVQPARS